LGPRIARGLTYPFALPIAGLVGVLAGRDASVFLFAHVLAVRTGWAIDTITLNASFSIGSSHQFGSTRFRRPACMSSWHIHGAAAPIPAPLRIAR
jgi:hypothetical protein